MLHSIYVKDVKKEIGAQLNNNWAPINILEISNLFRLQSYKLHFISVIRLHTSDIIQPYFVCKVNQLFRKDHKNRSCDSPMGNHSIPELRKQKRSSCISIRKMPAFIIISAWIIELVNVVELYLNQFFYRHQFLIDVIKAK